MFEDADFATDMLSDLGFLPMLRRAVLFRQDGTVFAAWGDSTYADATLADQIGRTEPRVASGCMVLSRPVIWDGQREGSLVIAYDLAEESRRARNMLLFFGGLCLLALAVSMLVSERLQLLISRPLSALADAAKTVTEKQAYSVRVKGRGRDEVGQPV